MRLKKADQTNLAEMMDVSLETNLALKQERCWLMAGWTVAMKVDWMVVQMAVLICLVHLKTEIWASCLVETRVESIDCELEMAVM